MEWEIFYHKGLSEDIIVPEGFVTDGASAPKVMFSLCPPMGGPHGESAVLHDYLYSLDSEYECTRKEADDIFYFAMIVDGVPEITAKTIYSGVRVGGGDSFKKCFSIDKVTREATERRKKYTDMVKPILGGKHRGGGDH